MALGGCPVFLRDNIRNVKNHLKFENFSDEELLKCTRLNRIALTELSNLLSDALRHPTNRSHAIDPETQILAALSVYSSGSFQWMAGRSLGIAQSSVSRSLEAVTNAICDHAKEFIKFPTSNASLIQQKQKFFDIAGIPNIISSIDCTHIPILAPHEHAEAFMNRKGFHSINVQAVCNADMEFVNICAQYPGSSHDSFIWRNSALRQKFATGCYQDCMLIGDGGYALEPWLLTPVTSPTSRAELAYNTAHSRTRNIIERCFALVKGKFRCLDKSGGTLLYEPNKACKIVIACCVLHNICRKYNLDIELDTEVTEHNDVDDNPLPADVSAIDMRRAIINRFM